MTEIDSKDTAAGGNSKSFFGIIRSKHVADCK